MNVSRREGKVRQVDTVTRSGNGIHGSGLKKCVGKHIGEQVVGAHCSHHHIAVHVARKLKRSRFPVKRVVGVGNLYRRCNKPVAVTHSKAFQIRKRGSAVVHLAGNGVFGIVEELTEVPGPVVVVAVVGRQTVLIKRDPGGIITQWNGSPLAEIIGLEVFEQYRINDLRGRNSGKKRHHKACKCYSHEKSFG